MVEELALQVLIQLGRDEKITFVKMLCSREKY